MNYNIDANTELIEQGSHHSESDLARKVDQLAEKIFAEEYVGFRVGSVIKHVLEKVQQKDMSLTVLDLYHCLSENEDAKVELPAETNIDRKYIEPVLRRLVPVIEN